MSRMFDEMPEELKMLLGLGGISPTDLTGEKEKTREEDFDFENPPLTCPDIPDSIVSAEAIKKMAEARKLMLEAKDLIMNKDNATAMSFKLSQSKNSFLPRFSTPSENTIVSKALQDMNASSSTSLTLPGIIIFFRLRQP